MQITQAVTIIIFVLLLVVAIMVGIVLFMLRKSNAEIGEKADNLSEINLQNELKSAPYIEQGISPEVVAVIAAAVASFDGGKYTFSKIEYAKPMKQTIWRQAAVFENTQPF